MAAGRGNRMRPLTDVIPKAMLPYKDDTLIGNSLKMLSQSVSHIHITVGYKSAMLSQYVMHFGVDSIFNTEGHSNSWWIHNTLMRYLDEPVLVLTCDNITELDHEFLVIEYFQANAPACMLVPVRPIPMVEGDFIEHDNGFVTCIQREVPKDIYCSGIQILNPARVVALTRDEGNFYSIWNQLIALRELRVCSIYPKKWFSVDTLEQLATLNSGGSPLG
jgi:NDP-sugar pyrophosphorylase family protein